MCWRSISILTPHILFRRKRRTNHSRIPAGWRAPYSVAARSEPRAVCRTQIERNHQSTYFRHPRGRGMSQVLDEILDHPDDAIVSRLGTRSPEIWSPSQPGRGSITQISRSGVDLSGADLLDLCLDQPLGGEAVFISEGLGIERAGRGIPGVGPAVKEHLL